MAFADIRQDKAERARGRPVKRLIAPIFLVVFGFCAVCAHVLIEARRATWERASEVATSLVAAIESDVSRNIEIVDLSLKAVVDNLTLPGIDRLDPQLRQLVLFDRSATAQHLGKIMVIDEAGNVRLDSRTPEPSPGNLADFDYFQAHRDSATVGLYISHPARSRTTGNWNVGISRRLSHPDGSFAGVVVASLRLSYFEKLFRNSTLGPHGNITLGHTDGTVLTRWPFKAEYIGMNFRHAAIFEHLARSRNGRFETYAVTDGHYRLFVYSQIGDLPLVVAVGQSTGDIYANWRDFAFSVSVMVAVLCAITLFLAVYLLRELGRRKAAEAKLATLATTDTLTGLYNRRHFNEVIGREWKRARREKAPLTLFMLDIDNFKSYNDLHGHQAGDTLLKIVGKTIADVLERGGDTGARYGGDEFAVLLPGTSIDGAKLVAEKIRRTFTTHCERDGHSGSGLSIGIACLTPEAGWRYDELVRRADLALYSAKHLGRNRTELASTNPAVAPAATDHPNLFQAA